MKIDPRTDFDSPYYMEVNKAREIIFRSVLPDIITAKKLESVIDIGCGIGYFSSFLSSLNLKTTGTDVREENIELAKERCPSANFFTANIEEYENKNSQTWNLVFCAGLLYHLENPFKAIRNLRSLCDSVCVIESRVHWSDFPIVELGRDRTGVSQAMNSYVMLPSRICISEMLYAAGFNFVYSILYKSDHEEFRSGFHKKPRRHFWVASLSSIKHPLLKFEKQMEKEKTNSTLIYLRNRRRFIASILEAFRWLY